MIGYVQWGASQKETLRKAIPEDFADGENAVWLGHDRNRDEVV